MGALLRLFRRVDVCSEVEEAMSRQDARFRVRLGSALIVLGCLINPWLLGYLLADDGSIDPIWRFAVVLSFSATMVLAGLQVLWRWVDRLSWSGHVGAVRATAVVGICGCLLGAVYWRVISFNERHTHTTVVGTGDGYTTPEQAQWAENFYRRSLAAALKHGWFDIDTALAQGFQVDRINGTHFPNLENMFDDAVLDPEKPEWLIYHNSPEGRMLMGFMFFTRELEEKGPTPAGPIASWHYHPYDTPHCAVRGLWTVSRADENGQCAEGVPVMRTPEMFHVWFVDHPLGRFSEMNLVPSNWEDSELVLARFHPVAVHFAIALFVVAVLLDLAAIVARRREYHRAAWLNLVLATVAVTLAVAAGMTAELVIKPTHEAHATLDVHRTFGLAALASVLVLTAWRYTLRGEFPARGAVLYGALSLAGLGAIGGAGYYGGEMVYTHGAGVELVDRFTRDRYLNLVQQVYRHPHAGALVDVLEGPGAPAVQQAEQHSH